MSFRTTQVFGLCFYLAWMYLVFNGTLSINVDLRSGHTLLWVHVISSVVGVVTYAGIVAFSRRTVRQFATRRALVIAGAVMALGTAMAVLPGGDIPDIVRYVGGALTGVSSCWVIVYWGSLFSSLEPRNMVLATGASFFFAFLVYYGVLQLPEYVVFAVQVLLPLAATLLLPQPANVSSMLAAQQEPAVMPNEQAMNVLGEVRPDDASARMIVPAKRLPWRIMLGILVVMFVYGGVRVYVGSVDSQDAAVLAPTLLMSLGISILAVAWGAFFTKGSASLGSIYKMALPFLATSLLVLVIFGRESPIVIGSLATACNVTIEILSWILMADLARTKRVPAFIVFAMGRGAVQLGMLLGQLFAIACLDERAPFAIVSIFVLMIAAGFLFESEDTELVFEAPSPEEREAMEERTGTSFDARLDEVAKNAQLTARETEIFKLWATGHGSKYIQENLVISPATVKTHVRHIYEKCEVHSRAEIIALLEAGE